MTTLELEPLDQRSEAFEAPSAERRLAYAALYIRTNWGTELIVLLLIGIAIPVAIAVHYGSMGAPSADDWAYDLSAFHLAFHGGLNLFHYGPSNMVGQLAMAAPALWVFGRHIWVLNAWTCACGFGGLLALDHLGRSLGLSRRTALFSALCLGVGPMWAALSTSFMLDVPAVSLMTIALALAASDRRTDRLLTPRWTVALAVAAVSFTIRDEMVIAVVAIAWSRLWRCGWPTGRWVTRWVISVLAVGAALLAFQVWRLGVPSGGRGTPVDPPSMQWTSYQWLFPLAGLMIIPVAAAVRPLRLVRDALSEARTWVLLAWAVVPGLPVVGYAGHVLGQIDLYGLSDLDKVLAVTAPPFGNWYFAPTFYGTPTTRPYIDAALLALACLATLATMVVVATAVLGLRGWISRLRDRTGTPSQPSSVAAMLGSVVAGSWLIYAVGIKWDLQAWDRYLLPAMTYVPMLVLYVRKQSGAHEDRRWCPRAAGLCLSGLALLGGASALAVDGLTGMAWNYSNAFAASVAATPRALIYTSWVWTSMQERQFVGSSTSATMVQSYSPCYAAELDTTDAADALYPRHGGSWVEPVTYAMTQTSDSPICRSAAG